MSLISDLIESLPEDIPVRSVLVGANWVVVCSRFCGLASTLQDEAAVLRTVEQGASFKQVEGTKLLTFVKDSQ